MPKIISLKFVFKWKLPRGMLMHKWHLQSDFSSFWNSVSSLTQCPSISQPFIQHFSSSSLPNSSSATLLLRLYASLDQTTLMGVIFVSLLQSETQQHRMKQVSMTVVVVRGGSRCFPLPTLPGNSTPRAPRDSQVTPVKVQSAHSLH